MHAAKMARLAKFQELISLAVAEAPEDVDTGPLEDAREAAADAAAHLRAVELAHGNIAAIVKLKRTPSLARLAAEFLEDETRNVRLYQAAVRRLGAILADLNQA